MRISSDLDHFFTTNGFDRAAKAGSGMLAVPMLVAGFGAHAVQAAPAGLAASVGTTALAAVGGTAVLGPLAALADHAVRAMAWAKAKLAMYLAGAAMAGGFAVALGMQLAAQPKRAASPTPAPPVTLASAVPPPGRLAPPNASVASGPQFVMALAQDHEGNIWAGSEDDGVFCFNLKTGRWARFSSRDGLGDDGSYALAVDRHNRVWVGHRSHGVSVYNGQKWQNYEVVGGLSRPDSLSGPLGERVFAIAVCPKDGDVWIATSAGLCRYRGKQDTWAYYTLADGLAGNQIQTLVFDLQGNIYVGSQCDGIAMADVAVMGKPSRVDDLTKGFFGLSPTEDGFLMRSRDGLGQRAVWYVKKVGNMPNLDDVWFSAYFSRSDKNLVAKLSNPPEKR